MARSFSGIQEGAGVKGFGSTEQHRTAGQRDKRKNNNGLFSKFNGNPNEVLGNIKQKYNDAVISFMGLSFDINAAVNNDWYDECEI